jgi:glycogen operon protein
MRDLVTYNDKHNEANGEDNRDGADDNRSWNCGAEGETDDREINVLRARQRRNLTATLLLSQGVPMIAHGDELGRTQQGNNNAYCQDNELAWIDWENVDEDLLAFTRAASALRAAHPVLRRRRFFFGRRTSNPESVMRDIEWFRVDGGAMTDEDWNSGFAKSLGVYLNGAAITEPDEQGLRVTDDSFLMLFNAHWEPLEFAVPDARYGELWSVALDTAAPVVEGRAEIKAGSAVSVESRSLLVLQTREAVADHD